MIAWKQFKKHLTQYNLIHYKKSNAKFRRLLNENKTISFTDFTSDINPKSSPTKIWEKIRCLTGNSTSYTTSCILTPNGPRSHPPKFVTSSPKPGQSILMTRIFRILSTYKEPMLQHQLDLMPGGPRCPAHYIIELEANLCKAEEKDPIGQRSDFVSIVKKHVC